MRRMMMLGGCVAALLMALPAPAQAQGSGAGSSKGAAGAGGKPAGKAAPTRARGLAGEEELNEMVARLRPDAQVQAALAERLRAKAGVMSNWDEQNRARMQELQRRIGQAAKDDQTETAVLQEQLRQMQAERESLAEGQDAQVQAVMPGDMRVTWLAPKYAQAALQRYRGPKTTPEQEAQIRTACELWLREAINTGQSVPARGRIVPALAKRIEAQVPGLEAKSRGGGGGDKKAKPSSQPTTKPAAR